MKRGTHHLLFVWGLFLLLPVVLGADQSKSPSAEQALKLVPIQEGVDFDHPAADETKKCKITARKIDGRVGWIVEDPKGVILRRFVDTDGDNVVDQWSYFKDGLEVYRDIDANSNGKADQYRWFHTGGSRWGLDRNEDGKIDSWKTISAEEVTAEVIDALAKRDSQQFARLVLTPAEVKSLGIGKVKAQELTKKIGELEAEFGKLATQQKTVVAGTEWVQSSALRPGVVPAGKDGSTKDVKVYENVVAIVRTAQKHDQVQIGTLVEVGDVWRVIDIPQPVSDGTSEPADSGFFYHASMAMRSTPTPSGPNEETQNLLGELEKVDAEASRATSPADQARLNARRADLIEKIAEGASLEDRATWLRQLADMISAAVQSGTYPEGAKRLESLFEKLQKDEAGRELAPYVKFRHLTADYGVKIQSPGADFVKVQAEWLENLEKYVADYPKSPDTAEAMLQLAIAQEFAGQETKANEWYAEVVENFSSSSQAQKAAGAKRRLNSVGKTITLRGKTPSGDAVDLAKYHGKVVLIQYWATWCEPAKADMASLKKLLDKHGRSGFSVIGVNLDSRATDLDAFLSKNRLPWPQIFEKGGLDSRPANELGILTLPTMILVDKTGKVVNRNIQVAELERAVEGLLR